MSSSVSTLVIKRPEGVGDSKILFKKGRYHMGFVSMCLWTIAAIVAAAQTETSSNVTGKDRNYSQLSCLLLLN